MAAFLCLVLAQDVNEVRPAAQFLPEACDLYVGIPDSPAVRRKLRKEPYRAILGDLTTAMNWPIDPSRILGLLGGELALAVRKDATLIVVDTGVKDNSYATYVTALLEDPPWKRAEEKWDEGKVVVLTGPMTWYTHSVGRYFLLSTHADALRQMIARVRKPAEACLARNESFRKAVEGAKGSDVLFYGIWSALGASINIPAEWAGAGLVFQADAIEVRMAASGKDLPGFFKQTDGMTCPDCVPADAHSVTVLYPVAERWTDVPGLDGGPLVLFDRGAGMRAVIAGKTHKVKIEGGKWGLDPVEPDKADPLKPVDWPRAGCGIDYRTAQGLSALLEEFAKQFEQARDTLRATAGLTSNHVTASQTVLETTPEGLSGRCRIGLKGR